jgi:hypothetical protein
VILLGEHHDVIDELSHSPTLTSAWPPAQENAERTFIAYPPRRR